VRDAKNESKMLAIQLVETEKALDTEKVLHADKLIMEMLANRTPPTCIQANLYAMAKVIHPDFNIVTDLPSLKYIKDLRIPFYTVAKNSISAPSRRCH
jgi:hypothetical protein